MSFVLLSTLLFLLGSLTALLARKEGTKKILSLGSVIVGSAMGLIPAVTVLAKGQSIASTYETTLLFPLHIGVDPLSAFFLLPLLGLSMAAAVYALGYLKGEPQLTGTLPFFPLLVAAMMGVVIIQDGFWFLIVWEIMSLTSFFLVTTEHGQREVRHAGWMYLATTHLATAFLFIFFLLLFQTTGSFAFHDVVLLSSSSRTSLLFLCAVIGFGTKAGMFPFHIWLPHAHPAAPSYISALMSGVMIKTGIYGLLRTLTFFPSLPSWCGEFLIVLGILSAVLGVLYALMQHDLKKLLAYHSVENIGIIVAGIGLGLVGRAEHLPAVETLGFGSALFHTVNHAVFKGLLFFGAGNIYRTTHTRRIDQLGGLIRTIPFTAMTFLIASAAICGLPPLNGFISEWFLYIGLFEGVKVFSHTSFFLCVAAVVSIAFAGGLAVVCFTKVFGVVFLGSPRKPQECATKEGAWQQWGPMGALALLCVLLGLLPQLMIPWLTMALSTIDVTTSLSAAAFPVSTLSTMSFVFVFPIGFVFLGIFIRYRMKSSKPHRLAPTWGCGFDQPTARMQYSASSYAEPLRTFFHFLLKPQTQGTQTSFEEHVDDLAERTLFGPLVTKTAKALTWVRRRQRNRIQDYLAYIFCTLLLLLLWEVWIGM